jgi:replicative DNA helicase
MQTYHRQDAPTNAPPPPQWDQPDQPYQPSAYTYTKLFDITAERAVLGACMMDATAITRISTALAAGDFYREQHRYIYEALQALADSQQPCDPVTLSAELTRRGKVDIVGGMPELAMIAIETPSAMHVEHYASIVADKATIRRLSIAAGEIAKVAFRDDQTAQGALDEAERLLFAVTSGKQQVSMEHIARPLQRVVDVLDLAMDGMSAGVPSGFVAIDQMLGGFQRSDLIICAARPAMGKSALMLSIADYAARKAGAKVAIFSLEMSKDQLVQRLLSMRTGIDSHRIRMRKIHDDEWGKIMEISNEIRQVGLYIDDTPALSIEAIQRTARRMHAEGGLDMIVVDYLQLMTGKGQNREQEIASISRGLKAMARELNVPVLALSQLSRKVEERADKRPMLSDLRESGSLEQDTDVVMFIYREDYYVEETDRQNIADIIVAKHRHGATGTVSLFFRKELTQFRDLEITRTPLDPDARG